MKTGGTSPPRLAGFYFIGLVAALVGIFFVFLLNVATPLEFVITRIQLFHGLEKNQWTHFILRRFLVFSMTFTISLLPFILILGRILKPVSICLDHFRQGRPLDPDLLLRARKCLINLPFVMVPTVIGCWILGPLFLLVLAHNSGQIDAMAAITFGLRAVMMGLISSAVVFFGMESHARKTLIPFFFPDGRLHHIGDTARLPIHKRLLAFYRVGSLLPLANIVITLFILYWQLKVNPGTVDARAYGQGVLVFSLMVFVLFFMGSGYMSRVVAGSISQPLEGLIQTIRRLRDGDLKARAQVVSNDEVGVLGDAVNQMIQGLEEKERIRDTFGRHVDPAIRDEVISGKIPLAGDLREVTILFADLKGFTAMGEAIDPREMVKRLNQYFGEMETAVKAHGGLVLQFLGDEIYAVFGAPVPCRDHAQKAFDAAMDMVVGRRALNRRFKVQGRPPLDHGIGIHTGPVVAANIGSPSRQSYMLVGDTVNLASRLQSLTRELQAEIILSSETGSQLSHDTDLSGFRNDAVRVRGRRDTTPIFYLPKAVSGSD